MRPYSDQFGFLKWLLHILQDLFYEGPKTGFVCGIVQYVFHHNYHLYVFFCLI